jgi:hypothetical protein
LAELVVAWFTVMACTTRVYAPIFGARSDPRIIMDVAEAADQAWPGRLLV